MIKSTNANGITDVGLYDAAYTVPAGVTEIPRVSASASDRDVIADVTQAKSKDGTAVVTFDYHGMVKTYYVMFASE